MVLWLFYLLGQLIHILKRADLTVASPENRAETLKHFLVIYWPSLAIRLFLCSLAFLLWIENRDAFSQLTAGLNLSLPLSKATAGFFGYFSDSLLDWFLEKFPKLKRELPLDGPESNPLSITGATPPQRSTDAKEESRVDG